MNRRSEDFAKKFQVREEQTACRSSARRPARTSICSARLWQWWPVLELEKGVSYRMHLSSVDWKHGFSLQPININIQVYPGYEHGHARDADRERRVRHRLQRILRDRPSPMTGKIYVTDKKRRAVSALPSRGTMTAETVVRRRHGAEAEFRTCQFTGLQGRYRRADVDQGQCGRCRRLPGDRRPDRPAGRADALAGGAPAARRLVLSHPDRARRQRAAVLDHLLRDGGALFRLGGAAQLRAWRRRSSRGSASC